MGHEGFFDEASARSKAKARLVAGYFAVWAEAMVGDDDGVRTSHYIVHATSSSVGHYLMADVMSETSNLPSGYGYHEEAKGWSLTARIAGLPGWFRPVVDGRTLVAGAHE